MIPSEAPMKENSFFSMPAEWSPHEATWLTWPKDPVTWPDRIPQAREAFAQMIEALTPHEKVNLLVDDRKSEEEARKILKNKNIRWDHLIFHVIPTVDSWIRDYGPIFVKDSDGKAQILDFVFNAWGNKYKPLKKDDAIPQKISPLVDIPMIEINLVLEGGSIDVNGKGSLLTTKQCLLNKNRNPHLSKEDIENYLKKYFGVSNILWLGEGIEGDDTDGHIDDITRFVSEDTIVTAVEEDPQDANFEPLQENLKKLQSMKDQDGKDLKIITLPMPGRLDRDHDEGRLPASYANFYIANEVVLVPTYRHKNDVPALEILQKLFPNRKVVGIECNDLIYGMGAIHCLTQQQPKI